MVTKMAPKTHKTKSAAMDSWAEKTALQWICRTPARL